MLTKFFVYLRVGPALSVGFQYALLVGGVAFIALTVIASLYIPVDDEMRFSNATAWRRESQTLTGGGQPYAPTVRVPMPASMRPAKEMNTYYNSLLDGTGADAAAARLNDDLCGRLDAVREVADSFTGSEYGDDEEDDRMV